MLLNCRAIFMGSPAMLRAQRSNLFQTFDLFPLVSSVYNTRGATTEIHPPLAILTGNSATYSSYAYMYAYTVIILYIYSIYLKARDIHTHDPPSP